MRHPARLLVFVLTLFITGPASVCGQQPYAPSDSESVASGEAAISTSANGAADSPTMSHLRETVAASDTERFRQAVAAVHASRYDRAIELLTPVFARKPSFSVDDVSRKSTAYWLGTAYARNGETPAALQIWWTGLRSTLQEKQLDIHATDAYVEGVFKSETIDKYSRAAEAYLLLMQIADARLSDDEQAVVDRHLAQLRPILPVGLEADAFANDKGSTLAQGGGQRITRWWRGEDAYPATTTNERLVEHLIRVSHAERHFPYDRSPRGYDERGEIFVRFGAPTKTLEVDFFSREMMETVERLQEAARNNLIVSPSDFADNQFWMYERGDEPYHYLFVDDGNSFRVGNVADVIPRHLLAGMGSDSGRNAARADIVLEAFRTCYEQLAPYHREYGTRYNRIQGYIGLMNDLRTSLEGRTQSELYTPDKRSDNSALGNTASDGNFIRDPHLVARSEIATSRQRDDILAYRQEERLPASVTQANADLPQLPVAVYPARFLNEDGSTRVELFWGLAPSGDRRVSLPEKVTAENLMVEMNVSQLGDDYQTVQRYQQLQSIPATVGDSDMMLFDAYVETKPITDRTHLRMQWDQWTMRASKSGSFEAQQRLRSGTARVDSLLALQGASFEMSDVIPLRVDDEAVPTSERRFPGTPYPFTRMTPAAAIGLHFEIYNLKTGQAGTTRYTVTYDVEIDREGRRFLGLFGTDDEQTSASTSYDGNAPRSEETILLDTNRWEAGDAITVRIRVRDEIRNEMKERTLAFDVVKP
ncbi:MAG: GWxTD domain-containing protein [Bacteroidetes bacterium]|jgi:GWxTD domain-containing protein|nr:GWxTD domain-containing protein [Bacteroidota bacterium]